MGVGGGEGGRVRLQAEIKNALHFLWHAPSFKGLLHLFHPTLHNTSVKMGFIFKSRVARPNFSLILIHPPAPRMLCWPYHAAGRRGGWSGVLDHSAAVS